MLKNLLSSSLYHARSLCDVVIHAIMHTSCSHKTLLLTVQTCQQCQRPMNRRAKWSDDVTWAAVKYCSDKCRKEAKRKQPAGDGASDNAAAG